MKNIILLKEKIFLGIILTLSAILNFANIGLEGTANSYYAAAVKSMTTSFKNFFFVSFDPTGFVTIDKPPLGFWFQAISAKIFGFHGWSILLPQAIAGVLSVFLVYHIVKKPFGNMAGLIAALCLAITPVFVATSRNNTIDNTLVLFLMIACWALSIAAEKGKFKYLIIAMIFIGLGFNIKMLQAYMVVPAVYITYLLSNSVSIKKRFLHLTLSTVILITVSLSWALIVDSVPASERPYIDSSTDNTVMELIIGHNGMKRLGFGSSNNGGFGMGPGGKHGQFHPGNMPSGAPNPQNNGSQGSQNDNGSNSNYKNQRNTNGNMPGYGNRNMLGKGFGHGGPGGSQLQGSFGGQTPASIIRLFSKNILSDQVGWLIVLAIFGFFVAAFKEKMKLILDTPKKQSLMLWFSWFVPVFIYFSYNTGLFHSYYLTMIAPPVAALVGIGISAMWDFYKEGGKKALLLPISLIVNGIVELIMLYNFSNLTYIVKYLIVAVIVLCFGASIILIILSLKKKQELPLSEEDNQINSSKIKNVHLKMAFLTIALIGILITPFVGSSVVLFNSVGSLPAGGIELLSSNKNEMARIMNNSGSNSTQNPEGNNSKLIKFLQKNKTKNQKYLLVVSSSQSGSGIILNTNESVMSLGGFSGSDNAITLKEFKNLVKKGEIRYVMAGGRGMGGMGGNGSENSISSILSWVTKVGTVVPTTNYSDIKENSDDNQNNNSSNGKNNNFKNMMQKMGGMGMEGQLYDLKNYTDK